jgi:hypothetical protein
VSDTLSFQQGDAQWTRMRERALSDLFWFCDVVLGFGQVVPMTERAHYSLCRFAERTTGYPELDNKWARLIKVPRSVGKSTVVTQGYAIQMAMKYPEIAILICNETERGASKFLAAIKTQLTDNEFLRALFPDRIPRLCEKECKKWSETEVILPRDTTRQESTFSAIGVGGSVTGQHPDLAIVDDMFSDEAMENARIGSFIIFEKVNHWISRLRPLVNAKEPWHGILWVGTPWWEGDSYEYVLKAFGYGEEKKTFKIKHAWTQGTVEVECYSVGDLSIYNRPILERGTSFFPERWPDDRLAKMRVDDPLLFAANMMLDPTAPEVVQFKPNWRRYYEWVGGRQVHYRDQTLKDCYALVDDLDVLISIDPAFTTGGTTSSFQAIMVTGGTGEGLRLILKAQATRQSVEGFVSDIVNACKEFKPRKLLIERAGQQIAFIMDVKAALNAAGVAVSVEEVTPGGKDPDLRIATLETFFERGQILGHRDHEAFWREYDGFPRSKFKDLLVALAYQPPFWNLGASRTNNLAPRQQQRTADELRTLYARMGVAAPVEKAGDRSQFRADGSRR